MIINRNNIQEKFDKNLNCEFICEKCGKIINKKFSQIQFTYNYNNRLYCTSCNRQENFKEKYGTENYFQSDDFKKKIVGKRKHTKESIELSKQKVKETLIKKFGSVEESYKQRRQKAQQTIQEKYGVDNIAKSEIIKEKTKQTNLQKYGTEYGLSNKEIIEKRRITNLEKYGVENVFQSKEIKNKIIETNKQKYGVKNWNLLKKKNNYESLGLKIINLEENICLCPKCNKETYTYVSNGILLNDCCLKPYSSNVQREIKEFIESLGFNVKSNNRQLIKPLELDLVIESKKLAVEVDGVYFHSAERYDSKYHLNKTIKSSKIGIDLIHIFDVEWYLKQDIVKSILKHKLGIISNKIFARKCIIKKIEINEYRDFCNNNHIQGYAPAKIKLGLFYNDELVQIMSFSKARYSKEDCSEMIRECSKLDYTIIGGKSKLLKYFERECDSKIISYCDLRYFNGHSYEHLGFKNIKISPPNYWYYKNKKLSLLSRLNFQKHKLRDMPFYDEKLSEIEIMKLNGYLRIYDCGNIVFKK